MPSKPVRKTGENPVRDRRRNVGFAKLSGAATGTDDRDRPVGKDESEPETMSRDPAPGQK